MDHFENTVAELIAASGPAAASVEDAYAAAQRFLAELDTADAAAQQRALGRLADVLPTAPLDCAGVVALACGALVEHGGDPERPLDALLGRLPEVLAGAGCLRRRLPRRAKDAPAADDDADLVERFGDAVTETTPAEAVAWAALDLFASAVLAVLARSADGRRRARTRAELLKRARAVADLHGKTKFLADMLAVLDDEDLLVLHPETGHGWKVRVRGVSDNFQLHTLLAEALIGDPEKGMLPGRRPDPRVAAAARDRPVDPSAALAEGAFRLLNWQGLRPDRTLPAVENESADEIENEGVPADIERLKGCGWCCWAADGRTDLGRRPPFRGHAGRFEVGGDADARRGGGACWAASPRRRERRKANTDLFRQRYFMKHAVVFGILGTCLTTLAVCLGGFGWLLLWPAVSFGLIAAAYAGIGPRVCGKRADGRLAWWAVVLLLPYLLMTWAGWRLIRLLSRETCCDEVSPGVWVGRRPFARDLPADASLIVDLTAEFPSLRSVRRGRTYLCVPTLDATAPEEVALLAVVEKAAAWQGTVYIHCALGHARSAMTAGAVLLRRGLATDADHAVTLMPPGAAGHPVGEGAATAAGTHRGVGPARGSARRLSGARPALRRQRPYSAAYPHSSKLLRQSCAIRRRSGSGNSGSLFLR